ncbi:MAG: hypothetical protein B1H02_07810 [Candidatus Latescibacteria bacterium 4484_107]|nr:MAG: hypothetical protein B1H02_07810 [Candidatus Latescibacteria bacterium 4484_107]
MNTDASCQKFAGNFTSVESRAEAGTGNIMNSLKGLHPSLFRGFLTLPVPSSLRLFTELTEQLKLLTRNTDKKNGKIREIRVQYTRRNPC